MPAAKKEKVQKAPRFYPADDIPKPHARTKKVRPTKLRGSITPGTVLILLAGRFRGKRVVCLKQLPSGLLLVTGPHKVNGVPLRRVNQAYVIATSTKVDISGVKIPEKINDAYFAKSKDKKTKSEKEFFNTEDKKRPRDAGRVADQKAVDDSLTAAIKAVPKLDLYLKARFSLTSGQFPHELKF